MCLEHTDILAYRGLSQDINSRHSRSLSDLAVSVLQSLTRDMSYLSGDDWAKKYRLMGKGSNYIRWDSSLTPFLVDIANDLSSEDYDKRVVVVGKPSQVGGSELALNEVLRRIHIDPSGMLYYMENLGKVGSWSSERFSPALDQAPFNGVGMRRSGDRTDFPGGYIVLNGVNSSASLSSVTARFVVGDEVARYPYQIGGEGDFLTLARGRIKTFGGRGKILLVSTFVAKDVDEGAFYGYYLCGDQKEYFCPCPHCGHDYIWSLTTLEKKGDDFFMKCPECGGLTEDGDQRMDAVLHGHWEPTKERTVKDMTSYRINGFHIHPDWKPWSEFYYEWQDALVGRSSLAAFYNLVLGLPYEEESARKPDHLAIPAKMNAENYYRGTLPKRSILLLTMGIDVQQEYLEWEIKGWTENMTCYSIDRGRIESKIERRSFVIEAIRALMDADWNGMKIWIGCIDCGYKPSHVYAICENFPDHRDARRGKRGCLTPTRGTPTLVNEKLIVGEPGEKKRGRRSSAKYWRIGTDWSKRELYHVLHTDYTEGVSGRVYAPNDYPEDYYEELVSERIQTEKGKDGRTRQIFVLPSRTPNEALDLHVMNRVAAEILQVPYWSDEQLAELRRQNRKDRTETPEKKKPDADKVRKMEERREERRRRKSEMRQKKFFQKIT